jgi:YgiT-type zinc finger domain-containing protein
MKKSRKGICPICGGYKEQGTTTFTVDINTGVIVVRNVPATVCSQCGEEWIENKTAKLLEKITTDARKKQCQFEVVAL